MHRRFFIGISVALALGSSSAHASTERSTSRAATVRTLEAINIEGEIAVPQVLFITARDQTRFRDGLRLAYRLTPIDVARSANVPSRLHFDLHAASSRRQR